MIRANDSWIGMVLIATSMVSVTALAQEELPPEGTQPAPVEERGPDYLYRNLGPYIGLGVGYNQPGDQEFDFSGTSTNPTQPTVPIELPAMPNSGIASENEYKGNIFYQVTIGYKFASGLRPEFEIAYRQNDADEINYPDPSVPFGKESEGKNVKITGTSGMFNLWYDLFPSSRFHPYIGGGIGATRFKLQRQPTNQLSSGELVLNPPAGPLVCLVQDCSGPRKSDDAAISYQAGAGLRYDMTDRVTVALDYRYLKAGDSEFFGFRDQQETHLDADYDTQSLLLSANYFFALPEPPPPPPPPPVVVKPICSDNVDNDGDGRIDFPGDPGCASLEDDDETDPPQCSDGKDNDGDELIDFPADKGCTGADDNDEVDPCKTPEPGERISLRGCGTGDIILLRGVNFEFDKSRLTPNARTILDGVSEELAAYPDIKIELGGHTDAKGTDEYNQSLSERRAASVVSYLEDKGVAADRMRSAGYGESQPIADNETDEGRELNRRVELKITEGVASDGSPTAAEAVPPADAPAEAVPAEAAVIEPEVIEPATATEPPAEGGLEELPPLEPAVP